jgi:UDP-N-acetylglucosamine 4,6-dehydratase
VAARIAPGCPTFETGLRPGEKLHETLVSEDEAPQTVWYARENGTRMFVIQPVTPSWPYVTAGVPVGAGFSFRSDSPSALSKTLPAELQGAA